MAPVPKKAQKLVNKVGNIFAASPKNDAPPTQKLNEEQDRINSMIAVLEAIDFYEGDIPQDIVTEIGLEETRDAIVAKLKDTNVTRDDMTRIDEILYFACDAFREGVKKGRADEAEWAGNAISYGLLNLREDVPESEADTEEERQKKIAERADWFENYRTIIKAYTKLDNMSHNIETEKVERKRHTDDFAAMYTAYKNFLDTMEGQMALQALQEHASEPAKVAENEFGEQDLMNRINELKGKVLTIFSANARIFAKEPALQNLATDIDLLRQLLLKPVDEGDEKLAAKIEKAKSDMVENLQREIHEAAEGKKRQQRFEDEIGAAVNTGDGKTIVNTTMREIKYFDEKEKEKKEKEKAIKEQREKEAQKQREAAEVNKNRTRLTNE